MNLYLYNDEYEKAEMVVEKYKNYLNSINVELDSRYYQMNSMMEYENCQRNTKEYFVIKNYRVNIDYIKIDAEGYEIEALIGAKKLIEKCKPFIHIEAKKKVMVKQNITMNDIKDYFESINYEQVLSVKSELLYAPK